MHGKRLFFLALAVLAVLYLASLGAGFKFNASEPSKLSDADAGWLSGLGSWLSPMGPRIEWKGLRCETPGPGRAGQSATGPIRLTAAFAECRIRIPATASGGDDYRKGSLRLGGEAIAALYLYASFDAERFSKDDRDADCYLENDPLPTRFHLKVRFTPGEEPEGQRWTCWLRQRSTEPVRLVALADGGTLQLNCDGCCEDCGPGGSPRRLEIELE